MKTKGRAAVRRRRRTSPVFDPAKVIDRATFEKPAQYSKGIQFVTMNGTLVVKDGALVDGVARAAACAARAQKTRRRLTWARRALVPSGNPPAAVPKP